MRYFVRLQQTEGIHLRCDRIGKLLVITGSNLRNSCAEESQNRQDITSLCLPATKHLFYQMSALDTRHRKIMSLATIVKTSFPFYIHRWFRYSFVPNTKTIVLTKVKPPYVVNHYIFCSFFLHIRFSNMTNVPNRRCRPQTWERGAGEGGGARGSLVVVTCAAFIAGKLWENCKD